MLALVLASCSIACPHKADPPTANGSTLVDWTRAATTLSTGVSLGDDIGPAIVEDKTVTFTPEQKRDELREVRLALHIERGDVSLVANPQGERPAEQAEAPRKIRVTVTDNGGWQITATCDKDMVGPASLGGKRVGFGQNCSVVMKSGDHLGTVNLAVRGDGKLESIAGFGRAEVR